jgi:transposase-like protein
MTKRHRRHSTASKREIVEAYFNDQSMCAPSQKYDGAAR